MVDFIAVIEKAVDGLSENTPEMRERVYVKARAAIGRQLDNIDPPLSDAVKEKQLSRLEEAISEVEDRHTEALPGIDEDVFADIFAGDEEDQDDVDLGIEQPGTYSDLPPQPSFDPVSGPEMDLDQGYRQPEYDEFGMDGGGGGFGADQQPMGQEAEQEYFEPPPRRTGRTILIGSLAVLLVAGLGVAVWLLSGQIGNLIAPPSLDSSASLTSGSDASSDTSPSGTETGAGALQSGLTDQRKFTQRLREDGTEVDEGPAVGASRPATEEGKTVAALDTSPDNSDQAPAATDTAQPAEDTSAADNNASAAPAIGQKMFLYEERLGQQAPTAEEGRVVWSIVRESPGNDLPPEPAIQANINLAEKGLSAILTIKRNADPSLPASHLIEIIFALDESFDGGGIKSIQNFALKQTEQDTGDSLIAVPAKITESFFMIALNDYREAVQLNLQLMRERNWIDLPVAYGNGRRALLTLEKGSTGAEVFDQVIRAWEARAVSSQ